MKNHWVMRDNELRSHLYSLCRHLLCNIQGDQQPMNLGISPAHQKSRIIEAHLCFKGGNVVEKVKNIPYCCHASHSFLI